MKKKKSKPTIIDLFVRFLAVVLAIALVIGYLAGILDPRTYKYAPFFGLAYPYVLFLNIIMIIWWCIRGRWSFAISTILLILLGWRALIATVGIIGNSGEGDKEHPEFVRMMTYNVHSFRPYGDDNVEMVRQQILELIRKESPDIICFQEYFSRKTGSFDTTDSLKRILKTPYYYFEPSNGNDYEAYGLAIFSKFPIRAKGFIPFDKEFGGNSSIFVDVEHNHNTFRVYNVHLQSISFMKQDYNYIDKIAKKMDPELTPSKRILSMLRHAFLKRSDQVDIMKAHMKRCQTPYLIAGDFNDTPASYAVTQLTASLNNAFEKQGTGLGRTYNGKFPNFQIDYIATSKEIGVVNYRIISSKLSDHFPVRSDLNLNP